MSTQKKKAPGASPFNDPLYDDIVIEPKRPVEVLKKTQHQAASSPPVESKKKDLDNGVTFELEPMAARAQSMDLFGTDDKNDDKNDDKATQSAIMIEPESGANSKVSPDVPTLVKEKLKAKSEMAGLNQAKPINLNVDPVEKGRLELETQVQVKAPSARKVEVPELDTSNERTINLSAQAESKTKPVLRSSLPPSKGPVDRVTSTDFAMGAKNLRHQRAGAHSGGAVFSSAEAALKQSENLRIAQTRISDLEMEVERLRRENEMLSTAGETLRRRVDELLAQKDAADNHGRETAKIFDEEKRVFRSQMAAKEREGNELRQKLDEMEHRLETNFKKIRVRERELEHRLEIVKMESATLVSTKDKMILELKRQIDQLTHEVEYGKQKSQEMYNQFREKQETNRRVVRALRIALSVLEGEEGSTLVKKNDE